MLLVFAGCLLSGALFVSVLVWFLRQIGFARSPNYGKISISHLETCVEKVWDREPIDALLARADALAERSKLLAEQTLAKMEWGQSDIILKIPLGTPVHEIEFLFLSAMTAHKPKRPNQAPEPTATAVTPPAAQEPRQP